MRIGEFGPEAPSRGARTEGRIALMRIMWVEGVTLRGAGALDTRDAYDFKTFARGQCATDAAPRWAKNRASIP